MRGYEGVLKTAVEVDAIGVEEQPKLITMLVMIKIVMMMLMIMTVRMVIN